MFGYVHPIAVITEPWEGLKLESCVKTIRWTKASAALVGVNIKHNFYEITFNTTFINLPILAEDPREATQVINEQEEEGEEDGNNQTVLEDIDDKEDAKAGGEGKKKKERKGKSKKNPKKQSEAEDKGDEKIKGKRKRNKREVKHTKDPKATRKENLNETEVENKSKSKIAPRKFPACSTYDRATSESCCHNLEGGCDEGLGGCFVDGDCKGDLVCWGQGSCTNKLKEVGILIQDTAKPWSCCTKPGETNKTKKQNSNFKCRWLVHNSGPPRGKVDRGQPPLFGLRSNPLQRLASNLQVQALGKDWK